MLWDSDPRTSEYCLLSGGAHCLPTASQLVSARLGINGALSLRHLCLWTFLLSSGLLLLSGSLPVPASVDSCRTPGPSQAISASWLVVVKNAVFGFVASVFGELPMPAERTFLLPVICLAVVLVPLLGVALFWALPQHTPPAARAKAVTAVPTSSSASQQTAHIDSSGAEELREAESAIIFSISLLTSLSAMTPRD